MATKSKEPEKTPEVKRRIEIPSSLTVKQLAELLDITAVELIKQLMQNGFMATVNQTIDYDTAAITASDLGYETTELVSPETTVGVKGPSDGEQLQSRPPVVTVMGHIDHGKTKLLDSIRKANVIDTEAGGITQHIGAYQVEINGRKVTFLDTPGHEAFTTMRARGAKITDIAVLVVAADDGIMPQTREAIAHARAAGVPIVVAINKIDKPDINLEMVKRQLSEEGLLIEEWGGDVIAVPVSAKMKTGISDLLENILIVADMLQLKADPNCPATGAVVEAGLDKTKGALATFLVQNGTLNMGDTVVVSDTWGRVKAMFNDAGKRVKKAGPSTPVKIMGLGGVPKAGDIFSVVANEKEARALAQKQEKQRVLPKPTRAINLDDVLSQIEGEQTKELKLILKTDVQGSIDPIKHSLEQLESTEVKLRVIHSGSGGITEGDVMLALASKGIIIGFNTAPALSAQRLAEQEGVDIRCYNIIYALVDDIERALKGMKEPKYAEVIDGHAEIRLIISTGKIKKIAGSYVNDGKISRSSKIRIVRKKQVVHEGAIESLKRFKDDVKEVSAGFECGIGIEEFNQIEVGDIIEAYRMERIDESAH